MQLVDGHQASSKLPIRLDHSDEASYLIGFLGNGSYPDWIDEFPKSFLSSNPKILSLFIRVHAYTSVGKTFESKIENGLRQRLLESALKQKT